ncbi:ABC transporter ATP-binding protein [Brachybacterium huguangmaarense]|uniref:ABC transporter ATP-binding protein n=1 Tax=Brachybacterium huguangmaarense TaxID=1652028 RepID=A0ABY6G2Z4_9MICO|nr:ABC transporter ATP-binding protein [Brachybacterium huguangmaarense]UYG17186.1 ABC transporter ATP-binding protein [Brachybacterium huguangmaarense]
MSTPAPAAVAPAIAVHALAVDLPRPRSWFRPPARILHDVSLTVPTGLVTAIVGTNGAGKTTLLDTVVGAHRPVHGHLQVLGAPMGGPEDALPREVGYVPDVPAAPRSWTCDDITKALRRIEPELDVRAFGRNLRRAHVDPGTPMARLSAGEATHVSLALAQARSPRLLILDEPFARLDPLAREQLVDDLRSFVATGEDRSVLLSTHDLIGMDRLVDHLVVLHEGHVVLDGDVEELLSTYLIVALDADGSAPPSVLRGARRTGETWEGLVAADDAAALPPTADLRSPVLAEIVTWTLREATR